MEDQQTAYRLFCQRQTQLPVFYQDWYLDAVCEGGSWSAVLSGDAADPVAVWPFFVKKKWGFRYATMPPFVKYMGPWEATPSKDLGAQHAVLQELLAKMPRLDGFMQNFHYRLQNWLPFYWNGFRQETRYTYLLNIQNTDAVFRGINRNMRRNILKAEERVRLECSDDAHRFFALNALSFARKGLIPPFSKQVFLRHDAALAERGQRQIFFAVDPQGRTHSAAYLIWDTHSAYYHLSGDDPALRSSGAGIWILWQAICFAHRELGLDHFDFEGSMLPEVEAIRRQFGARQTAYFFVWKYSHPLFALLKR
jgi:hypothetical protein